MWRKKLKCPKKLKPLVPFIVVTLYFLVGIVFYNLYEGWDLTQSVFFTVVTISTVGYGDYYPSNDSSRLFTIFYMIFGVYIIFYGFYEFANKGFTGMKNIVGKSVYGDPKEMYIHPRKRLLLAGSCLCVCILVGAIVLTYNEGWTFVTALYYAIETSTTVGYGDIRSHHDSTRIFLIFYIIISTCLVLYLINTINTMRRTNQEFKKKKKLLRQKQFFEQSFFEFSNVNTGMTKHQFVIFILKHLGIIDQGQHIDPWLHKFDELDTNRMGYLNAEQLRKFCEIEKQQSKMEYIEMSNVTELDVLDNILDDTGIYRVIPGKAAISATYQRVMNSMSTHNNHHTADTSSGSSHHSHQHLYTSFLTSIDAEDEDDEDDDDSDDDGNVEAVRGILV